MKIPEGPVAIGALIAFSAWLFIGLPIYLGPLERIQYYENAQAAPQSTATEPNGTIQAPFFIQVIPSSKTAAERTQEAEDREEKRAADRWLVRWTAALFAATVGLILATGILGYFAYRQVNDMRESIAATKKAADAAEKSADTAEQAYKASHRVVFAFRPDVLKNTVVNAQPTTIMNMQNVGPGVAYGVGYEAFFQLLPIENLEKRFKAKRPKSQKIMLTSEEIIHFQIELESPLTQENIADIIANRACLCAWGMIIFENTFGENSERDFCFAYHGTNFKSAIPSFRQEIIDIEKEEDKKESNDTASSPGHI